MKIDNEKVDKYALEIFKLLDKKRRKLNLAEETKFVTKVATALLMGVSLRKLGGDPARTKTMLALFSDDVMENVKEFKQSRKPFLYRLF